jgi:DNA repair photolyase
MTEVEVRQDVLTAIYIENFGDRCNGGKTAEDTSFKSAIMSPDLELRLNEVFKADTELEARYSTPAPVGERSDREFHLCGKLFAVGFNEGEIYLIMSASPQQKWRERGDDYRIPTIRRAIEAEMSKANRVLGEARKTLDGLAERVKADISAIKRQDILQALAVLRQADPIDYAIVINSLELPQIVKSAVKERVKKIASELYAEEETPSEACSRCACSVREAPHEEQIPLEITQKALEILEKRDPIQYILDTLTQFHAGDRKSAELLLCSIAIGSCLNAYGTQPKLSGASGKGKTHLAKALRHLMPPEWIFYTSLSPKALYRATDPSSPIQIRPGMTIFSDDVRINADMEDTLKRSMSNFQEPFSYLVVQKDELIPLHLPERLIWWLTSVLDDQEEQLINRFFSVGIDESSSQDVASLNLTFTPLAEGRMEFPLTEEVRVCRELMRIIKNELWIVKAPFLRDGEELAVNWANPEERRNPGRFVDLLAAYAILRSGPREVIDEGDHLMVIATVDDFNSAKVLYESRAENLTTKLNDDDLHLIRWLKDRAGDRPYEFNTNDLAKEYTGRDGKTVSPKTLDRRLRGRNEKGRRSYGLIDKIRGGALTVELRSEIEEVSGIKKLQKRYRNFVFDPSRFDLLGTYCNVVSLKMTGRTHQTPVDQEAGSSLIISQDIDLEEKKNGQTQKTNNMNGLGSKGIITGIDIFKKKYQIPSQDGSSGSSGSIEEDDSDSYRVSSGSVRGTEICEGCGKPTDEPINLAVGMFCRSCAQRFAADNEVRKATLYDHLFKLKAIYTPSGEAMEYADLALNIYRGCSHGCKYCYNRDRFNGPCDQRIMKATLENIEHDLKSMAEAGERKLVHLSFVGDLYDMGRSNNSYTRQVQELFRKYNHPYQVLTKGGLKAASDFDCYGPEDRFGVTLTFCNDDDSKLWEPGAALPKDRIEALRQAHERGIKTWASLEPVIDPEQSLRLIDLTHEFVDYYGLGKLNHCAEKEKAIDWHKYLTDAEKRLKGYGKQYKIKQALSDAAFCPPEAAQDADGQLEHGGINEDGADAEKRYCQKCGQKVEDLIDVPGGSFCPVCMKEFDAEDAARKETPVGPRARSGLDAEVKQVVAQFESERKLIIPSVIAEDLGVSDRLPEVVALIRNMGYVMTQDIDPISHMLIWRLPPSKSENS